MTAATENNKIFNRSVKILSITRGADIEENGDATIKFSLLLEDQQTKGRYNITDLDIPMDWRYERLQSAYRNKEPIDLTLDIQLRFIERAEKE